MYRIIILNMSSTLSLIKLHIVYNDKIRFIVKIIDLKKKTDNAHGWLIKRILTSSLLEDRIISHVISRMLFLSDSMIIAKIL